MKLILSSTLLLLLLFSNTISANSQNNNSDKDKTVDSILGALAAITVDETKKVINL